jgi:pyruvate/2-oxoglutarate dehydrogenase complex dihydrolipoamide dehydrogenase (E3) component
VEFVGAEYGVRTGPVSVDLHAVRKRKQGMVEGARNNFESGITAVQGLDLDLLRGEARFIAPKRLGVSMFSFRFYIYA